jgi:hypothetical protein
MYMIYFDWYHILILHPFITALTSYLCRTKAFKVRALCAPPLGPPVNSRGTPRQAT